MSKSVKEMIMRDYTSRFGSQKEAMVVSIRQMKAVDSTRLRSNLHKHKIRVTVVQNALARRVITGTPLEPLGKLLTGPSALAFGGETVVDVAREVMKLIEKFPQLELKGAVLDGQLFEGKKGVEELSKFPTREEAIGQVVTLVISPARKLVGQIQGPGSNLAGIIKAVELKLEKGEAIAKAG
ncbi:MAG: 50S ribosomal protein L10 [Planctomycetota bacterium]|nr:50S ribosomal protein L10 [Planctomycetota bacterium]